MRRAEGARGGSCIAYRCRSCTHSDTVSFARTRTLCTPAEACAPSATHPDRTPRAPSRCLGGEVTFPSPPMAVELLARDARASVPCPRPSERVGLAQVARRASDPLAPRSAWSLAGNSRHAVGAACVLVLTSMSSAWPFHRKVRPLTAVAPCAARICMLSKAHMPISERPPAPDRS